MGEIDSPNGRGQHQLVGHTENIIQATLWGLDRLYLGIHMHIPIHVHESEGEQGRVHEGPEGGKGGKIL